MLYASPLYIIVLWLFTLLVGLVTALMEIQIEGGNGWAACLPTWRFAPQWVKALLSGKDITGYHLFFNLHIAILFHLPIVLLGWSWLLEFTILGMSFGYVICEDVLWFIMNPFFGWRRFTAKNIPWYSRWLGPLPNEYFASAAASALCAYLRGLSPGALADPLFGSMPLPLQHLTVWALGLLVCVVFLVLIVFVMQPRIAAFQQAADTGDVGHRMTSTMYTMTKRNTNMLSASSGKLTRAKPSSRRGRQ